MKKIFCILFTLSLLLVSCKKVNNDIVVDDIIDDKQTETQQDLIIDSPYDLYFKDDQFLAIGFLGYFDEDLKQHLFSIPEISNLLAFFPSVDNISVVENLGDELYIIFPKSKDVEIVIYDDNEEIIYNDDKADMIMLYANLSDIHTNTTIKTKFKDQSFNYSPQVDNVDSTLINTNQAIIDISMYNFYDFQYGVFDVNILLGDWYGKYLNNINEEVEISLSFISDDIIDFENKDGSFELHYFNITEDLRYEGNVYFKSPMDFKEEIDDYQPLLHFDLYATKDTARNQLYGKFLYRLISFDKLVIKHVSFDPLTLKEKHLIYFLERSSG